MNTYNWFGWFGWFWLVIILSVLFIVVPVIGDTQLNGSQILPCPGDCVMISYRGLTGWGKVGPGTGLEIADVDGQLLLLVTGAAPAVWVKRAEVVLRPQASWVLMNPPITGSLSISRNGLNLVPGEDWEIAGQTVTFLGGNIPREGDVLDFHYQR